MKIAVFLCGQPRMLDVTWKTILGLFPGHEVDIYFHFWKITNATNKHRTGKQYKDPDQLSEIITHLQPKNYVIEDQKDFSEVLEEATTHLRLSNHPQLQRLMFNVYSHYYSFSQMGKLIKQPSEYDFIFKTRTDAYFDIGGSREHLLETEPNTIVCLPWGKNGDAPGDHHWFGETSTMLAFCERAYDTLSDTSSMKRINAVPRSHGFQRKFYKDQQWKQGTKPFHSVLVSPKTHVALDAPYEDVLKSVIGSEGLVRQHIPAHVRIFLNRVRLNNPNRAAVIPI